MILRHIFFLSMISMYTVFSVHALSLEEQFRQQGYIDISTAQKQHETFDTLYTYFEELTVFLQNNPSWAQKLYNAKERFLRTKERNYYSTDFFGFYDESTKRGRCQISFYYSTHFHDFICARYPELRNTHELIAFLGACRSIQESYEYIFINAAKKLRIESIFSSTSGHPPILIKVIKYLPEYTPIKPHYDGTAFSLFLDSTNNESLLLSSYKSSFTPDDFTSPPRASMQGRNDTSCLLIPGTLLTEFAFYPTAHIVIRSSKVRYATIAFAMRPHYTSPNCAFTPLPNFSTQASLILPIE